MKGGEDNFAAVLNAYAEDPDQAYRAHCGQNSRFINNLMNAAGWRLLSELDLLHISFAEFCKKSGIDPALKSRLEKGERSLNIDPQALEAMDHQVLDISCQDHFLNKTAELALPDYIAAVAQILSTMAAPDRDYLLETARAEVNVWTSAVAPDASGHRRSFSELLADRVKMLQRGSTLTPVLNCATPTVMRQRTIRIEKRVKGTRLDLLIFLSILSRNTVPLDFFICEQLFPYVKFYQDDHGEKVRFDDKVSELIGIILALPPERRDKLLALIFSKAI